MLFVIGAFLIYLALISYRGIALVPPVPRRERRYWLVLIGCLVCDLVASYGFYALIRVAPAQIRNYSLVITVLSLLAAAVIVVKFAVPRDGWHRTRRLFVWALSVFLMFVLYLLFGSISYYSKIIQDTNFSAVAYVFIPAIMLAILWINTAYDHWDYAERGD